MTVANDVRALAPASERLGIVNQKAFEVELNTLLPKSTWSNTSGYSALNGNGSPIELCVSASKNNIRGRLVVDPCYSMRSEIRFHSAWATALNLAQLRAPELFPILKTTRLLMGSWCLPEQFSEGPLWLASVPGSHGMAIYCDSQPLGDKAKLLINDWLKFITPESIGYFQPLLRQEDNVKLCSFGIEGYNLEDARVKIYFRLTCDSNLQTIGVTELYSAPIIDWLKIAIPRGEIHPDGLVLSISAPLNGTGPTDAKADVCGHCVAHSLDEWDRIFADIPGAKGLPRFAESLNDDQISVAFAGLGVTSNSDARVNVYLQAVR
ncbi:hypothetical protein [Alteromonas sp. S015]|uniref:hypothetical protein n=1 Tax=Alteromonas sp. S015 TaxID=3117401 RepID=UPI002FE13CAA